MNAKKSETSLLSGSITQGLFTLAIPIFFTNLLQSAYQFIDAFWVGKLGPDAVAAVSVSSPITFLIISFGSGFAVAGSIMIAQYVGGKKYKEINHVTGQTLLTIFVLSIFLGGLGYFFSPAILGLMHLDSNVTTNALAFMRVSFIGLVFVFTFYMFQAIMRGIGQVKVPMYIMMGSVSLNFFLDPFFIYGWGPIPAMGVSGAAIATLFTQLFASVVGLWILFKGKYGIHITLHDFIPDPVHIKKAFFLGLPSSLQMSAQALGMMMLTFLITSFGTTATAAYGAGSNIIQLIMIPAMALSLATSTMVGQNIGARNIQRASSITKTSIGISFIFFTALGAIIWVLAPTLIGLFIPESPEVIREGSSFIHIVALSYGFVGIQYAITGSLRAAGDTMTTLMIGLVSQWIIQFPLAYILSKHTNLGLEGVWIAFPITNILVAIIAVLVYARGSWKHKTLIGDVATENKVYEEQRVGGQSGNC